MGKTRKQLRQGVKDKIHPDHVGRVIDRMLSGVYNPRSLNPEDDLIDAIDKKAACYEMLESQDTEDIEILMLRIVGYTLREISALMVIPKSTVQDRLKRFTWARPLLNVGPSASDPALIGESIQGLHGVQRDRDDEREHRAWISLGNGGYRKRGQVGSDGTQNG